ncbi:hypothetical protein ACHQM5_001698 [Ranunculus cassubicifolius]
MEDYHRKHETEKGGAQVVVEISNEETKQRSSSEGKQKQRKLSNSELTEMDNLKYPPQVSIFTPHSPEISQHRPPKVPSSTLIRRVSVAGSAFSKPKSRFVEPSAPIVSIAESTTHNSVPNSPYKLSPGKKGSTPATPKTPFMASPGDEEEDDEEIFKKVENHVSTKARYYKKIKIFARIEWVLLICIWGFLITSLTVRKLQHSMIWGLEIWKWCVLVMVIVSGHLMMKWLIHVVVFLIEKNFLLKNKVLYFMFGVKKSVQIFLWLGLVLLTWVLLINRGVKRSENTISILNKISRALIASLVGALIWMIKTLLVKLLATNFQSSRYFDRIQESLFHQYVLKALSRELEDVEVPGRSNSTGHLTLLGTNKGKGDVEQEVINMKKLNQMKQDKVSAWTMRGLIDVITTSGLSTISNEMDQLGHEAGEEKNDEITNEWEAKAAAIKIFKNVTKPRSNAKYIEIDDLMRFLTKEELDNVLPLFEGAAEIRKIKKSALKHWVVKVYHERKSLAHSLNDTKTAVKQLNNIISAIIIVVIIIIWLLIMGIATIQVFIFISSQMLVAAFMFGNTAKQIFECIIFVFVMHPFDVGDRCVIDGVQMIVEEMNILTTVFLRFDSEKIYYPNSVLATKPISNFYRSPDMGDNVEFSVDISTSIESIGKLKARIKMYIENKPQHWRSVHSVVVKEIENLNKMKMVLFVTHTMNHQDYLEKSFRRTELVLEMKKIFEELQIKYHLLPQEVHLSYVGSAANAPAGFGHQ